MPLLAPVLLSDSGESRPSGPGGHAKVAVAGLLPSTGESYTPGGHARPPGQGLVATSGPPRGHVKAISGTDRACPVAVPRPWSPGLVWPQGARFTSIQQERGYRGLRVGPGQSSSRGSSRLSVGPWGPGSGCLFGGPSRPRACFRGPGSGCSPRGPSWPHVDPWLRSRSKGPRHWKPPRGRARGL